MNTLNFQNVLVCPITAREILEHNAHNRKIKEPVVLRYAQEMAAGRWKENTGETIKISKTKKLLDGQHRLYAVIKSGVAIRFTIATGLDDDIFDVIDTGSNRNASDIFKIAGIKYSSMLPSVITTYNQLRIGKTHNLQKNQKNTNSQLLQQYEAEPDRWEEIARLTSNFTDRFHNTLQQSVVGGVLAYLSERNKEAAIVFLEMLCTGKDCYQVVWLLRERLFANNVAINPYPKSIVLGLIVKAWNHFCNGDKPVKKLYYNPDNESFPVAKTPLIY